MAGLKEVIEKLKAEFGKGEETDKEALASLVAQLEPMAARDWAQIKKLEKKAEASNKPESLEPGKLESLEAEIEELKGKLEDSGRVTGEKDRAAEKAGKTWVEKESALTSALASEKAAVERLVLDAGLTSELLRGNVKASLLAAAKARLKEKGALVVETEGENRRAVARILKDGQEERQELGTYVKDFLGTDEGREMVQAKANAGAGAQDAHGAGGAQGKTMKQGDFWALGPKERAAFMMNGGMLEDNG